MKFTKYRLELALANGANLSSANLRGANLCNADLSSANLYGANLSSANLYGAGLSGANLSRSVGLDYTQCAFAGHGECGRTLTAAKIDGEIVLWCGCFTGGPDGLRKYIEDGADECKESRTLAMEFVLKAIEVKRA